MTSASGAPPTRSHGNRDGVPSNPLCPVSTKEAGRLPTFMTGWDPLILLTPSLSVGGHTHLSI